jgi:hypothetical protein
MLADRDYWMTGCGAFRALGALCSIPLRSTEPRVPRVSSHSSDDQ